MKLVTQRGHVDGICFDGPEPPADGTHHQPRLSMVGSSASAKSSNDPGLGSSRPTSHSLRGWLRTLPGRRVRLPMAPVAVTASAGFRHSALQAAAQHRSSQTVEAGVNPLVGWWRLLSWQVVVDDVTDRRHRGRGGPVVSQALARSGA
jgi:hypothetical protein